MSALYSCYIWLRCWVPCVSVPRPERLRGPPRGLILEELGCLASSHESSKALSLL
ncbi:rCG38866, isoform CRA_a [Rattus norvegicus]|uniref:RCG38866, isoform CRA_a n=1 Tax=Rattus norvegicus TaxID=10116 RepID=A6K9U4_RAT|nr:rCG38866, isoform CRA_a [Rattus norvegicus]EDL90794.1 rCG38866, isoform CRA_a [Rattus norvegicus]